MGNNPFENPFGGGTSTTPPPVTPPAGGEAYMFTSETARDTFFGANRNLLVTRLPVWVAQDSNTVSPYIWQDNPNPANYDENFWLLADVRSGTGTFRLRDVHAISSTGENVVFQNVQSGNTFFPIWQGYEPHTSSAAGDLIPPSTRNYGDYQLGIEINGAEAAGGTNFRDTRTLTENRAIYGYRFVPDETYSGQVFLQINYESTGRPAIEEDFFVNWTAGVEDELFFRNAAEFRSGEEITMLCRRPDIDTFLRVRQSADGRMYLKSYHRPFTEEEVAPVTTPVQGSDPARVSSIVAGSGITLTVSNGELEIRTGGGGGTPPPASADIIYYGLSSTDNPATVDVSTLTTESDPTNPDTISTGTTTAGQFFILLVPTQHDVSSIFDNVLQQDVTSIFTRTEDVRQLNSEQYTSYVIGPLNAGGNEPYTINF